MESKTDARMWRTIPTLFFCWLFLLAPARGQDVFVPRELKAIPVHPVKKDPVAAKPVAKDQARPAEPSTAKALSPAEKPAIAQTAKPLPAKADPPKAVAVKPAPGKEQSLGAAAKPAAMKETVTPQSNAHAAAKVPSAKADVKKAEEAKPAAAVPTKEPVATQTAKAPPVKETQTVAKAPPPKAEQEKAEAAKPAVTKEPNPVQAAKSAPPKAPVAVQTAKALPVKETPSVATNESAATSKTKPVPAKESEPTVQVATKAPPAKAEAAKPGAAKSTPGNEPVALQTAKTSAMKEQPEAAPKAQPVKPDPAQAVAAKPAPAKEKAPVEATKAPPIKEVVQTAKASPVKETKPNAVATAKVQPMKSEPAKTPQEPTVNVHLTNMPTETAWTKLADGFDFPVGKPDAENYYKARGFRPNGHLGEDWDGIRGGDTDFKDPIYSIGDGIVVFARDVYLGWGNVVIVRHAYKEGGAIKHIDALYGHLYSMNVKRGQKIARGQLIGTMGTAHGQYDAHLHLEIRKNIEIGLSKSKFQKDFSNYYDPTQFIAAHRKLSGGGGNFRVAMNTFTHDAAFFRFASTRNYSARKRNRGESAAALRRALTSTR